MAYAPRRRGAGKEVAAFATAFAQGMKLFSDDDRGGRARSRDPYSDENIAKRDERLGSTSALGKFFGMGEGQLTGFDRGRAALDEKMRIAAERGDASLYKKYAEERLLLENQSKIPYTGETWKQSPSENRALSPSETEAPLPIPRPGPGASLDAGGQDTVASSGGENDLSIFSARGGMVPALHAARGMSVPSRTGSTYGEEDFGFIPEGSDDEGFDAVPGPEPTPPTPPGTPSVDKEAYDEGRVANLGLSRDPEELASAAAPAIAAGMDRIQSELKPSGAISAQDPAYQDKLQKFARGEGRMSDEEISQMDAAIDPDGTMSPGSRSAARIAAIYKFYQDKGDPQTAQNMAARVVLYDKFASQTRGAMALQALNDGDIESGVKLLEDAYNNNMPDAKTLRANRDSAGNIKLNDDKTISFNIGWDKLTGFKTSQEGKATQQDLIQLASNTATGKEQMQRLMEIVGTSKGGGTGRGGVAATNRAASASAAEGFNTALGEVDAAAKAVATARAGGDPDAIKAADDALRAARTKAMSGARSVNEQKQRDTMVGATIARAISASGTAPARTGGATGGTKEERDAAAQAARMADLDVRERGALADISPSRFQDESERERAVGRLQDARLSRTDITAGREPSRKAFTTNAEERQEPITTALDAYMKEGQAEAASGKIDVTRMPKLEGNKRRQFIDTVDMAMARNDISPDTAVRAMYDAVYKTNVTPQLVGDGKGGAVLSIGDERLVVDRNLYRRIASLRGAEISAARIRTNEGVKAANERAATERGVQASRRFDRDEQAVAPKLSLTEKFQKQKTRGR